MQKISYGAHIIEASNNYPEKFEAKVHGKIPGKPVITLRAFTATRD
jgi:hypothetical protein